MVNYIIDVGHEIVGHILWQKPVIWTCFDGDKTSSSFPIDLKIFKPLNSKVQCVFARAVKQYLK